MEKISYNIKFYSDWHTGSGLSAGTAEDVSCIKDNQGFPYVPGKTIKGILRDAANALAHFGEFSIDEVNVVFGKPNEKGIEGIQGSCFFTDVEISLEERNALENSTSFLYRTISSTALEPEGVAKEKSLRTMQVSIPMTLIGQINIIHENGNTVNVLEKSMKVVKQLGTNRNRGLGRCEIFIK